MSPEQEATNKAWVAALKSGKYRKAKKQLRAELNDNTFGYCCLGVLCEMKNIPYKQNDGYMFPDGSVVAAMPSTSWFMYHTGLTQGQANDLASINDDTETFGDVIHMIEEYIKYA